jgi:hypothetical protein
LTATIATNLDQAVVKGETGTSLAELIISATPPRVELITIRLPKVEGNFAGPVVLLGKPSPVIDDDNHGESAGNGDGQIDPGERIELTLTVRNDGTVPVEGGFIVLVIHGRDGPRTALPEMIPIDTLPADEPVEVGPFVFDVSPGEDPSLLSYSLSYLNAGGLSNETLFKLPLDVEHLNVPVESEITVRFSEPVIASSLEGSLILEKEDGTELIPVSTKLLVDEQGSVARLRPLKPLNDDSIYRVTLTDTIIDRDGHALVNAPIIERFRTEDLSPPASIDPGKIEMSVPDNEGFVTITGSLGSVNPDDSVIVLNETTGFVVLATVYADGSFEARIYAEITDEVTLIVQDYNGNETRIDPGPFVRRDPVTGEIISVVIGHDGGTVTSSDGTSLIVPAGALYDAAELSISFIEEDFTLPGDIADNPNLVAAFDSLFTVVNTVRIEADINKFANPVQLLIPPPEDAVEGDLFVIVRRHRVTMGGSVADLDIITGLTAAENPVQTLERLEVIDSATLKDEGGGLVLSTDSPPFPGIMEPGVYTILKVEAPLTFLAGEVKRNTTDGFPVVGAIVRSLPDALETLPFVAITDSDGHFVIPDAYSGGPYEEGAVVASRLDVFDPDFIRVIRLNVRGVVGLPMPQNTVVAHLIEPFVLPDKLPKALIDVLGDIEPPTVNIYVEGPSLVNGFSRVGDPLKVTVNADDNDEVAFLALEVDQGDGFKAVSLSVDGTFEMTPLIETLIIFRAQARDPSGNTAFAEVMIRTIMVDAGGPLIPGPVPGQSPRRIPPLPEPPDYKTPPDEVPDDEKLKVSADNKISFDGDIVIRFSEPLDSKTINKDSVKVKDPEGNNIEIDILTESNDTIVRITPKRYLRLGACYTVYLSSDIRDLNGENLVKDSFNVQVLPPVQVATIELPNTKDISLIGDVLIAINRSGIRGEGGKLNTYQVRDEKGQLLEKPILLASEKLMGHPSSLTTDCNLVFVGNTYMGSPATKKPVILPSITTMGSAFAPLTQSLTETANFGTPEILLSCSPMFPGTYMSLMYGPSICYKLSQIWENFPNPPSNIEVFDLTDPGQPDRVGGKVLNYVSPVLWDPNTFPTKVEATSQGIAVMNFMENIEILTPTMRPESIGVVEHVYGYAQFPGRCDGGLNKDDACIEDFNFPPVILEDQCSGARCAPTTEFLDAAFFDGFAVVLQKDGIRTISIDKEDIRDRRIKDHTLKPHSMSGTFVGGRVEGVPKFEWRDSSGTFHVSDLVFVASSTDNKLIILDVTDPKSPKWMSEMPDVFGNMSFDACRGLAYVYGGKGEFHVIDFNDPKSPRDLNKPGGGNKPFQVQKLGAGVSFNGNTNHDGVVYLANRPGIAIVQVSRCSKIGSGCGNNAEEPPQGGFVKNRCVGESLKFGYRSACKRCPGLKNINITVNDTEEKKDHIIMVSDPPLPIEAGESSFNKDRPFLKLTLSLDETYKEKEAVTVTLTQQGTGKVSFRLMDDSSTNPNQGEETLELELSPGQKKDVKVFGEKISAFKNDTMIQARIGGSGCLGCKGIRLTVVGVDLDVDSDNDLDIDQEDDVIESIKNDKYRGFIFWINEYRNKYPKFKGERERKIGELKNLENLATLRINMSALRFLIGEGTESWLPDGYSAYLEMEKKDKEQGAPRIRIYRKVGVGTEYLRIKDIAKKQVEEIKKIENGQKEPGIGDLWYEHKLLLDPKFFNDNAKGEFLFEGLPDEEGKSEDREGEFLLRLVVEDSNHNVVAEDAVYITLMPLRHMYRMANARACAKELDKYDSENINSGCVKWQEGSGYTTDHSAFTKSKIVVFVHGYNVAEAGEYEGDIYKPGADDSFDDVFRRLYWTGVTNPKGGSDFIGLTWFGDEIRWLDFWLPHLLHFNRNVFNALYSSLPVAKFLKDQVDEGKQLNLFVHSLGNVLISNAIKRATYREDLKDLISGINRYVLHEAAVPANAYNKDTGKKSIFRKVFEGIAWWKGRNNPFHQFYDHWEKYDLIDQDPWGNYFAEVPRVVEMVNTYSKVDRVVNVAWVLNEAINRPDIALKGNILEIFNPDALKENILGLILSKLGLAQILDVPTELIEELIIEDLLNIESKVGKWDWEELPEYKDLNKVGYYHDPLTRRWDELSYYFQTLSHAAGGGSITGIRNINGQPCGINCDSDFDNCHLYIGPVHSAFVGYPLYKVWPFWKVISEELK